MWLSEEFVDRCFDARRRKLVPVAEPVQSGLLAASVGNREDLSDDTKERLVCGGTYEPRIEYSERHGPAMDRSSPWPGRRVTEEARAPKIHP